MINDFMCRLGVKIWELYVGSRVYNCLRGEEWGMMVDLNIVFLELVRIYKKVLDCKVILKIF